MAAYLASTAPCPAKSTCSRCKTCCLASWPCLRSRQARGIQVPGWSTGPGGQVIPWSQMAAASRHRWPALGSCQPRLLLVPALACDASGIRLGYGGGWYDRLRAEPAWAQVPAVAVLPRGCRVERLPRDPWDVPLQGWLDEDGLAWLDW
jgi:5-formyltetrahydrofolate cyclo-ligase